MSSDELTDAKRLFDVFEMSLQRSGGPFLVGALSLADLVFVPTLIRIMSHGPNSDT
jgi:glutathione S-transferase